MSHLWDKEEWGPKNKQTKKKKEGGTKGIEKERKEGRKKESRKIGGKISRNFNKN